MASKHHPSDNFEPEETVADSGYVAEALGDIHRAQNAENWGAKVGGKRSAQRSVCEMSDNDIAAELEREERLRDRGWKR